MSNHAVATEYVSVVKRSYPHAMATPAADPMAYHRWSITTGGLHLGGGPTEVEAWRNAWVHIDAADRARRARFNVESGA